MIAYQTAFLKTYHPNEFIAACMTYSMSNTDTLSEFYEELKRININIEIPNINTFIRTVEIIVYISFIPTSSLRVVQT